MANEKMIQLASQCCLRRRRAWRHCVAVAITCRLFSRNHAYYYSV